jgi:RNA recognition motif-containing protein
MSNSSCVLYIGAIPYNWDVDVIRSVVCGSGPVVDVRCMMDNASKNKGFCFVEYLTPLDALNALTLLSKVRIEGRKKMRIELSKEGLRSMQHTAKPVLKLNRLLLPANVMLPGEMSSASEMTGDIEDETDRIDATDLGERQYLQTLKRCIRENQDVQNMVGQLLANGMDLRQISGLVTQFMAKNGTSGSGNAAATVNTGNPVMNNMSMNGMNNMNMNNMNMNMNGMNNMNMNNMNMNNTNMNGMNGMNNLNMNMPMNNMPMNNMNSMNTMNTMNSMNRNMNTANNVNMSMPAHTLPLALNDPLTASTFLPLPPATLLADANANANANANTATSTPDAISKTLATIPPGVLIELLAKLKLVLSSPQPDAATYQEAANILNENPKLAVAAAQALLLMGIVDIDVLQNAQTQTQTQNQQPQSQSQSHSQSQSQSQSQTPVQSHSQPSLTPMQMQMPIPTPTLSPAVPPEWQSLPAHTIAKLLALSPAEAGLVFQVLQLTPEQIGVLPPNERAMATQLRAQYL